MRNWTCRLIEQVDMVCIVIRYLEYLRSAVGAITLERRFCTVSGHVEDVVPVSRQLMIWSKTAPLFISGGRFIGFINNKKEAVLVFPFY